MPTGSVVGVVNMYARKEEASVTWADRAQGEEVRMRMQGQDGCVKVLLFFEEQWKLFGGI